MHILRVSRLGRVFKARIEVWLKPGIVDVEGRTVEESLRDLGFNVSSVRVGKVYVLELEAANLEDAKKIIEDMCVKMLVNPVKDSYNYVLEES